MTIDYDKQRAEMAQFRRECAKIAFEQLMANKSVLDMAIRVSGEKGPPGIMAVMSFDYADQMVKQEIERGKNNL